MEQEARGSALTVLTMAVVVGAPTPQQIYPRRPTLRIPTRPVREACATALLRPETVSLELLPAPRLRCARRRGSNPRVPQAARVVRPRPAFHQRMPSQAAQAAHHLTQA